MTLHASDGSVEIPKLKVGSDAAGDILYHNGTNYVRLPKGTDGQVLKLVGGVPTWGAAGGITVADEWRLEGGEDIGTTEEWLDDHWERIDGTNQGTLGSAMTESSGEFTFPSTGIWDVRFVSTGSGTSEQDWIWGGIFIAGACVSSQYASIPSTNNDTTWYNLFASSLCDIQNTSTQKAKFKMAAQTGYFDTQGDNAHNRTYATFIRLGDT